MNFQEFPKWKYSTDKECIVPNAEAEGALEGDWFDTPSEAASALKKKLEDAEKARAEKASEAQKILDEQARIDELNKKDTGKDIDSLRETAKELGVDYHPRTGAAKLEELIKAKIEENGEPETKDSADEE